ncbi:MAG: hypothetical protein JXA98_02610 [Methanosarcinaceae archaeon]|nr:hypothetical protein [Methanosarcinaceae archaeon]
MIQKKIDQEMENLLKKLLEEKDFDFLKKVVEKQGVLEEKENVHHKL